MTLRTLFVLLVLVALPARAEAPLRGHGGPVRALAVSPDGRVAISGSFDQSAILWAIDEGAALAVLRFHDGAVNAAAALPDGRMATGGEDGRVALWRLGSAEPVAVFADHAGPIAGLAVSPDGARLASASWDGTARIRPLPGADGPAPDRPGRVASEHRGNVNGVAFLPDGRLVTVGYDAALRVVPEDGPALTVTLPTPLNAVATAPDGEIAAAGADGTVRLLGPDGRERAAVAIPPRPVIALAVSPDGGRIAAATVGGAVAIIDRRAAKVLFTLVGPGLPVWSLAFRSDQELLTGGSDRLVRRWDLRTGEPIGPLAMAAPADGLAAFRGERGAEVFRACAACHTLGPDGGNRAGPTLHGIFGRRIATAPGYGYSEALRRLDLVWSPETVARLFEVGPSRYTPGTKMPEQTIGDPRDREALVRFLERATR
ncbi:cytochrome c class I [Methylobacterium sp. 4-46]|uniref:c-type cytochrome n=1 Tax=unclassified Methylobacterium TaxID=2615210 RepID=UPI000152DDA9|nr:MULTISPECIES: c-type cytochrome [Methylobacterium]ACA17510.1 cytochrome c class I [Methylobacterium sp. 4-46]WFT83193.1 c-type cytochrome [Methylobacterium nodulans]